MSTLKQYARLPTHIVEDHNEALRPILRSIATKHLPFSNNLLIHFDSHPDLLIPANLLKSEVFDKEILFDRISIENWIMPAVFAGHFDTIVWIKPPWSNQIQDGVYRFSIGTDRDTGFVKVSSELLYFVSEMLYCSLDQLDDKRDIVLHVLTVGDKTMENQVSVGEKKEAHVRDELKGGRHPKEDEDKDSDENSYSKELKTIQSAIDEHNGVYVLDVDLDFFSTLNPFLDLHRNVNMYDRLSSIYHFELDTLRNQTIEDNQNRRRQQIEPLEKLFRTLDALRDPSAILEQISELSQNIADEDRRKSVQSLVIDLIKATKKSHYQTDADVTGDSQKRIKPVLGTGIPKDIRSSTAGDESTVLEKEPKTTGDTNSEFPKEAKTNMDDIDWLIIHDAGCTWDSSTQVLPHHPSTDDEIRTTLYHATTFLDNFVPPTLVTVARSSLDDYCPPDKVDFVQELFCAYMRSKYESLECILHYQT
uniref:UPF0489 protein C5orf22 homolog n=1 Tax=Hirondellea gigas TaxID=1518452 RepID=A0A2P2I9F5_9CRUS